MQFATLPTGERGVVPAATSSARTCDAYADAYGDDANRDEERVRTLLAAAGGRATTRLPVEGRLDALASGEGCHEQ